MKKTIKIKFSHDTPGIHKFLFMIKTNFENFVIPIKIKILDHQLNFELQNFNFGIISNSYVN